MSARSYSDERPRERVLALLAGHPVDRTPIGEVSVCDRLVRELTGLSWNQPVPWAARRAVIQRLGHDLVTVSFADQPLDDALFWVRQWREATELFVVAMVPGLLTRAVRVWGQDAVQGMMRWHSPQLASFFAESALELQQLAAQIAAAGADVFMASDPLATPEGVCWPLEPLRALYLPFLTLLARTVRQAGLFFFLRAPGSPLGLLEDLTMAELDGIQGFCEGDEGSLAEVRAILGPRICLWGGVDANLLSLPDAEITLAERLRAWHSGPAGIPTILGTRHGLTEDLYIAEVERLDIVWATIEGTPRRLGAPFQVKDG